MFGGEKKFAVSNPKFRQAIFDTYKFDIKTN